MEFEVTTEKGITPGIHRVGIQVMTEAELAAALSVTESTLAQWRKSGYGPLSVKIGRGVFYTYAMVEAWVDVLQEEQGEELEKEIEEILAHADTKTTDLFEEPAGDGLPG